MKVFCKKSYIDTNVNFFKIQGAGYGEKYTKWESGKSYEARIYEAQTSDRRWGIYEAQTSDRRWVESIVKSYYIITETPGVASRVDSKEFSMYFSTIEQMREEKIEQILNNI
jgi:hypothetical protein